MTTTAVAGMCRHRWRDNDITHTCWEPPRHRGDHECRIGPCRQQPTTTPQEAS